jgi:hypothetical protein
MVLLLLLHLGHPFKDLFVLLFILLIRLELMPLRIPRILIPSLLLLLSMHFP